MFIIVSVFANTLIQASFANQIIGNNWALCVSLANFQFCKRTKLPMSSQSLSDKYDQAFISVIRCVWTRMTTFIKRSSTIQMIRQILTIYISCKYYRISYYIKINLTTNHYYKLLWSSESFEVKYIIGIGIPIEFPSQRKKN